MLTSKLKPRLVVADFVGVGGVGGVTGYMPQHTRLKNTYSRLTKASCTLILLYLLKKPATPPSPQLAVLLPIARRGPPPQPGITRRCDTDMGENIFIFADL